MPVRFSTTVSDWLTNRLLDTTDIKSEDNQTDSRASEIIELEKLTIKVESDDEITLKLRTFLRFYLDMEIQNEFIFQRPAEFNETKLGCNRYFPRSKSLKIPIEYP